MSPSATPKMVCDKGVCVCVFFSIAPFQKKSSRAPRRPQWVSGPLVEGLAQCMTLCCLGEVNQIKKGMQSGPPQLTRSRMDMPRHKNPRSCVVRCISAVQLRSISCAAISPPFFLWEHRQLICRIFHLFDFFFLILFFLGGGDGPMVKTQPRALGT